MADVIPSPADVLSEALRREYRVEDFDKWMYTIGAQPDEPNQSVTFYNDDPFIGTKTMEGGLVIKPGIQIRVRGKSHIDAFSKIQSILNWCITANKVQVLVESKPFTIMNILIINGPLMMGLTSRKMTEFSLNVRLTLREGM